jgi:hypothetical protein
MELRKAASATANIQVRRRRENRGMVEGRGGSVVVVSSRRLQGEEIWK